MRALSALLLLGLLTGCSSNSAPAERPADFRVAYAWREGSLPPPYHYEYTITIRPDGSGEMVMVPDYPSSPDVPTWTEPFQLDATQHDQLYKQLVDQGLFSTSWAEIDDMAVGGSSDELQITADGSQITIPQEVVDGQKAAKQQIAATVQSAVPQEIREKLEAQRQDYVEEHE